jgi:hypothetical protein
LLFGFILHLLHSLSRLPSSGRGSWRDWKVVSVTFFSPTVFISTAKISYVFWATVLVVSVGVLHVTQMPNVQ